MAISRAGGGTTQTGIAGFKVKSGDIVAIGLSICHATGSINGSLKLSDFNFAPGGN